MGNIVQLQTCSNAFEAQIIKARLEAEGIPAIVADENMSSIYGNAVSAFSPRVLVREEDLENAQRILEDEE